MRALRLRLIIIQQRCKREDHRVAPIAVQTPPAVCVVTGRDGAIYDCA